MENNPALHPSCHVCGNPSSFLLRKDDYDLYQCPACQLVFVFPQPTPEYLEKNLYSYESGYMSNRARQDLARDPEASRVSACFDYFVKRYPGGHMLDVGCGNGQMLYWAKQRGITGAGVELNRRTAERAMEYGFEVFVGFLKDAPFTKHSFDFIFLGEIIEHVNDPREFVQECLEFLKPGGLIAITTPNIDCPWSHTTFALWKYFGVPWSSVTPPYHLFQFNPANLDMLMREMHSECMLEKFLHIPPLKYELGMLHVLKRFKKDQSIKNFSFMVFSYGSYLVLHTIFRMAHPFMKKDFQMVKVYEAR